MKKLSDRIADFFVSEKIIDRSEIDIYEYGIELLMADIINISSILLIGLILHKIVYTIIFLLIFCIIRTFTGGYHAAKEYICRSVFFITYGIVVMMMLILPNSLFIVIGADIFAECMIIMFSPVEHPYKELTKENKKRNRLRSIIGSIVLMIISFFLTLFHLKEGLVISLTLCAIAIFLPIGEFSNKKRREKNEVKKETLMCSS